MHEIAICETLVGLLEQAAHARGITRIRRTRVRVGKMAAFELEQLEICLKGMPQRQLLAGTAYEIEEAPVTLQCARCQEKHVDTRFDDHAFAHRIAHAPEFYTPPPCPACGGEENDLIRGKGFEILEIE